MEESKQNDKACFWKDIGVTFVVLLALFVAALAESAFLPLRWLTTPVYFTSMCMSTFFKIPLDYVQWGRLLMIIHIISVVIMTPFYYLLVRIFRNVQKRRKIKAA
jgi:ABC-type transport system involved in cytochrome c biogenesis permease subunit